MATSRQFMDYILEQLSDLDGITCRKMMGEYIVYYHGKIAAYVCDNRFLAKPVPAARRLLWDAPAEPPYPGAKKMLLVENTDDREFLSQLLREMYPELPEPTRKKGK